MLSGVACHTLRSTTRKKAIPDLSETTESAPHIPVYFHPPFPPV